MYGSDDADSVAEVQTEELTGSDDSDVDGTEMTVETEEMTSSSFASAASPRSAYSPGGSTGSLDENLRLAARMAVTQSLEEDEEVIAGFAGWGRKNPSQENVAQEPVPEARTPDRNANSEDQGSDMEMETEMDMDMDMEMTNAVGGILRGQSASPDKEDEINEDLSMDITSALGGILSKAKAFLRRKSVVPSPRSEAGEFGEQTMDFTTIMGDTEHGEGPDHSRVDMDGNEDMSMEFTTAVGGVLSGGFFNNGAQNGRRQTMAAEDGNEETAMMDMTTAVGRILPADAEAEVDEDGDQTMGMDMTVAVGGIIKSATGPEARSAARKVMEQEADEPDSTTTARITHSPKRHAPIVPDENADPGFSPFRGKGLRRSPPSELPPVARSPVPPSSSPMRQTPSPVRTTAQAQRSPTRTPPSLAASRSSSPMRNLSSPAKGTPGSAAKSGLFRQDPSTGLSTPRVVLTPQGRRLSGVGADRPGLGSPRVAEIFDRRESIGEAATDFVPSLPVNPRRNVAFADPRALEAEIERERQDEQENEGREGTLALKEMIQGLSPKKNPFRGRKSLHVGSAVGLLGKRPAELDDDEESEEMDGVKRLKGHQGSPVKNIRLQSPPSKADTTTGRKTRPSIRSMQSSADMREVTPTVASSPQRATTPASQGLSRNTPHHEHTVPWDEPEVQHEVQHEDDGDRIHLQDFLNMTSIRFMELTTTKRRHTVVPSAPRGSTAAETRDDLSLERCVVAGACTVPMLELYQHVSQLCSRSRKKESLLTWHSPAAS
jgi:kinetochore protein Spc7/SPC105